MSTSREVKGLRVRLFETRRNRHLTHEQRDMLEPLIPDPVRRYNSDLLEAYLAKGKRFSVGDTMLGDIPR